MNTGQKIQQNMYGKNSKHHVVEEQIFKKPICEQIMGLREKISESPVSKNDEQQINNSISVLSKTSREEVSQYPK